MIWLGAHLSPRIARWIEVPLDIEARPLRDLGLRHADDEDVWQASKAADVIIPTKDSDFAERVQRLGPPPRIHFFASGLASFELDFRIDHDVMPDYENVLTD